MNTYETITALLDSKNLPYEHYEHTGDYEHHVWKIPGDKAFSKRETKSFSIALIRDRIEVWKWNEENPVAYGTNYEGAINAVSEVLHKEAIAVFPEFSLEFERLVEVAMLLTKKSPKRFWYYVSETFFDYGQNWKWTTIMCTRGDDTWQALNPREQEEIVFANDTKRLEKVAKMILEDSMLDKED